MVHPFIGSVFRSRPRGHCDGVHVADVAGNDKLTAVKACTEPVTPAAPVLGVGTGHATLPAYSNSVEPSGGPEVIDLRHDS